MVEIVSLKFFFNCAPELRGKFNSLNVHAHTCVNYKVTPVSPSDSKLSLNLIVIRVISL